MSRLYLITGFLGSGKSTFLKNFLRLFQGQKMQMIINEFGREGVDGTLLAQLGIGLEEIAGGSVFCSCRMDQFEKTLQNFVKKDTEVILVEASGLSDPTGVRKLFQNEDRYPAIDYQGAVCLVDAVRFPKIYRKSVTSVKQLAASDLAVINKTDLATEEQLEETRTLIRGQRPDIRILETSYGEIHADILTLLRQAEASAQQDMPLTADLTVKQMTVTLDDQIPCAVLEKFLRMFLEVTFRVKGFVRTQEGLMLVNCTGNVPTVEPCRIPVSEEKIGRLTVLSGAGMPMRKRVREAASWYQEYVRGLE